MSKKAREVDPEKRKEEDNLEQSQEDGAAAYDDQDGFGLRKKFRKLLNINKKKDDKTKSDSDDIEAGFKPDTGNAGSDAQPEAAKTRVRSPSCNTSVGKPTQETSTDTTPVNKHGSQTDSGSPGFLNQSGVPGDLQYAYNNTHKGFMVILVNEWFVGSPPRIGADKDRDILVDIAQQLEFKYKIISNTVKSLTVDHIESISQMDFSDCDCFIFVVSSHGDEIKDKNTGQWDHIFLSCDDKNIYTREVINLFDEKNCPTLKGKPKLFFIQACRGKGTDDGETVKVGKLPQPINNSWGRSRPDRPGANFKYDTLELVTKSTPSVGEDVKGGVKAQEGMISPGETEGGKRDAPDTKGRADRLPKSGDRSVDCGQDMVIVFASISGMMAWRNKGTGSWMLYYLHQALKATTEPTNLLEILTTLNYEMARRQSFCEDYLSWHAKKAIAVILHRLQKKLLI